MDSEEMINRLIKIIGGLQYEITLLTRLVQTIIRKEDYSDEELKEIDEYIRSMQKIRNKEREEIDT
jgi:hypothetical protein